MSEPNAVYVDAMRERVKDYRDKWRSAPWGSSPDLDGFVSTDDITAMLDEIVALRREIEMYRHELCSYDDAYCADA